MITSHAVCPLHSATCTCIDSMNGALLQWQFRNATTNTFLGALRPTNKQQKAHEYFEGVLMTAALNQTVLLLSFNSEPQTESIRIFCCAQNHYNFTLFCSDCSITLTGKNESIANLKYNYLFSTVTYNITRSSLNS